MHCDPFKAPIQANISYSLRHQLPHLSSAAGLASGVGPNPPCPDFLFFEQREIVRALLQRAVIVARDSDANETVQKEVSSSLERVISPSLSGSSAAICVGLVRAALQRPLGEVAVDSTTDPYFSGPSPVSLYSVRRSPARATVNLLCTKLPLSVETQLILELALCSSLGPVAGSGRPDASVLKQSNERLQLKVISLLEEDSTVFSELPSSVIEAIFCLVDWSLRKRIKETVKNAEDTSSSRSEDSFPLRALLNADGSTPCGPRLDVVPLPLQKTDDRSEDNAEDLQNRAEALVDSLLANMANRGATMEPPTADKFVAEVGSALTASTEKCETAIRELSKLLSIKGAPLIAHLISAMCRSHLSVSNEDQIWVCPTNILSGGWPGQKDGQSGGQSGSSGQQETLDWNIDVFLRAVSAVESNIDWKDVVRELDNPNFEIRDRAGLRFLWQLLLKAFDNNVQRIPMDIVYSKWQNSEAQFSLLKQILICPDIVKLTECQPATRPEPVIAQEKSSAGGGAGNHDDDSTNPLIANWKIMEVHDALLSIAERPNLINAVVELYKSVREGCPDTITAALLQLKSPVTPLRRVLLLQLIPHYLGVGAHNAQAILHFAWSGCPQHIQADMHKIVKEAMVEYYNAGEGESSRLTRILEIAQEIKCLQSLLATGRSLDGLAHPAGVSAALTFVIDLACLASRREYLKLDKWMTDNLSSNLETFMPACAQFLARKLPYLTNPTAIPEGNSTLITDDCVHTMLATMLSMGAPKADKKTRLTEIYTEIQRMMENFLMWKHRPRQGLPHTGSHLPVPPQHTFPGPPQPPGPPPPIPKPQPGDMYRNTQMPGQNLPPYFAGTPKTGPGYPQGPPLVMGNPNTPLPPPVPQVPEEFAQPSELSKHVSKEIEDEANSYFQKIYNQPQISSDTIKEFLEMLKRFSNSTKGNERDVFQCMIKNLFEEYRFFPSYPDKELTITAQLFGGIVDYDLVRNQTLHMAHRYVAEAIKKPQNMKMFYFGIVALDCFKTKLKLFPSLCHGLATCQTFNMFPDHLQAWLEAGAKGIEPVGKPKGTMPLLTHGKLSASTPQVAKKGGLPGKPSIAAAANIDTLLGASDKVEKIIEPNEHTADKIGFIINNLSQANVQQKAEEFKELVGEELHPWFARYMVVKRASIESNFHSLYVTFLDTINSPTLSSLTLTETYRNIRVLLRSDKDVSDFTDRALLKSLGHWLGLLTIARNRPILTLDIDLKALLIEAYHKGLQDLLYVVPFIAKILESATKSKIFKPPSPFTMGLLYALVELHSEQGLKLNLKFEVEVLCKQLNLDIQQLKADAIRRCSFHTLKDHGKLALLDSPLLGPPISQNPPSSVVPAPQINTAQQVGTGPHPHVTGQPPPKVADQPPAKVGDIIPMMQQFGMQTSAPSVNTPMVPSGGMLHNQSGSFEEFLQQQQQQQQMGVGVPGVPPQAGQAGQTALMPQGQQGPAALSQAQLLQQQQQQQQPPVPQYSLREFNAVTPNMLPKLISVPPNITLFQTHPSLKMHVRNSVEQSIQEWMKPVVERCLKISLVTCENIVKKDFALEPDENKMRLSLHNMVRAVTAAMVIVTCKEPLYITITNNAKKLLRDAVNMLSSQSQIPFPSKEHHIDQAAAAIAAENVELATCFIQKTAIEQAINEADKKFASEYEARKAARKEGKVYCDHNALNYQERIPEILRLKIGGIPVVQMAVYEEFARNVPGFASSPGPNERPTAGQFAATSQHDTRSAEAYFAGQFPNQAGQPAQKMQQAQQQMMMSRVPQIDEPAGGGGLFEKMFMELEMLVSYITTHISSSLPHAMPHTSQLAMNVHVVQEALQMYRQSNFELTAGYIVVHKTMESLLEGLFILSHTTVPPHMESGHGGHPHQSEWSTKYRETHILVLKVLADRSLLGFNMKLPTIVLKVLLEHPNEEARYNLPVFDSLLRANLIFVPMFDMQLANLLEQQASFAALAFAKDLVRVVASYRESGVLPEADLPHTLEAIYHHRRLPPPMPPQANPQQQQPPQQQQQPPMGQQQQQQRQQQQPLNPALGEEFGAPELMMGQRGGMAGGPGGQALQLEYNSPPMAMMHSGMSEARNPENDPPDLQSKTECLLQDWVNMYSSSQGKDSTKAFQMFVQQMNMQGILKTDDLITKFFRLSTEMCVEHTYRHTAKAAQQVAQQAALSPSQAAGGDSLSGTSSITATQNSPALAAHQCVNLARNKCFLTLDAYVRLIALLVKLSGDQSNPTTKVNLLNKVLGIIAGVLVHDHETRASEFRQLAYHRMFLMLFLELTAPEPILEVFSFQTLMAFCNTLHALHPCKVPGFAFAWLELISHRMFLARMLAITPQQKAWGMFAQLLQDLFKFLAPFLRNMELTSPIHLLYKGTIRVLLVLLHDFPEFLVDYHHGLCDLIPANCVQMRNLILSAFPRHMRLPDPFTPHLRIDTLPECTQLPRILPNYTTLIASMPLRKDLDSFLKTRQPAGIVAELIDALSIQQGSGGQPEPGSRYNIPLINAVVLYIGSQAIQSIQTQPQFHYAEAGGRTPSGQKGQGPQGVTVPMTWQGVARTPHAELFEQLMLKMDNEGRYLVLNAIANQLRFPNSHTAYFSALMLALFAGLSSIPPVNADEDCDNNARQTLQQNTENNIREQITRVLLERLIVNRPHPWGLLVTFVELLKNQQLSFWTYDFIRCAPEIEKLFDSVARSCVGPKSVGSD